MTTITYWDLFIPVLDQKYIDDLIDERDVDCSELDISYVFECENFNSAKLTNAIIWEIFYWIIMHNVTNIDDQNKLIDSIYTNAFCSWLDISADEVESKEAKDLVRDFNG